MAADAKLTVTPVKGSENLAMASAGGERFPGHVDNKNDPKSDMKEVIA